MDLNGNGKKPDQPIDLTGDDNNNQDTTVPAPVPPPPPAALAPLPTPAREPRTPPALANFPPIRNAQDVNAPLRPVTAFEVRARLADPAMDYDRQYLFQTPNIGNDPRQYQVIADMYNEIGPDGTLTDAITYLEAAFWNFGQALQDQQRVERLINPPHQLDQDALNSRLDRSNARGGRHFEVSKLRPEVKTTKGDKEQGFDHAGFSQDNPRDVLRLNRRRQEFFDREIGPIQCPPRGKAGDWWHDLEKWEVERRYVMRDYNGPNFPNWTEMAAEHNRGFQNRRLPGALAAPPVRHGNKITQHINRCGLNKHKLTGPERHKLAQRDLHAVHEARRRILAEAWKEGFSATKADVDALDKEDAAARAAEDAEEAAEEDQEAVEAANTLLQLAKDDGKRGPRQGGAGNDDDDGFEDGDEVADQEDDRN